MEEAKPHWGLRPSRSSGKYRLASVIRRCNTSMDSICGRFVVISPRTTNLFVRHVFEWLKGTGARIVVFQQQSLRLELVKKLAADRFIASLRQPPAALVTASDVKSKSHIGKAGYDRVVELDAERKPLIETPAELLVEDARLWV